VQKILHDNPAVLNAWAGYELSQMDSAREGKPAPNFALADASGQTYRLSQFRGRKSVVLSFVIQDT
jgi:AhpC/TSA family